MLVYSLFDTILEQTIGRFDWKCFLHKTFYEMFSSLVVAAIGENIIIHSSESSKILILVRYES